MISYFFFKDSADIYFVNCSFLFDSLLKNPFISLPQLAKNRAPKGRSNTGPPHASASFITGQIFWKFPTQEGLLANWLQTPDTQFWNEVFPNKKSCLAWFAGLWSHHQNLQYISVFHTWRRISRRYWSWPTVPILKLVMVEITLVEDKDAVRTLQLLLLRVFKWICSLCSPKFSRISFGFLSFLQRWLTYGLLLWSPACVFCSFSLFFYNRILGILKNCESLARFMNLTVSTLLQWLQILENQIEWAYTTIL